MSANISERRDRGGSPWTICGRRIVTSFFKKAKSSGEFTPSRNSPSDSARFCCKRKRGGVLWDCVSLIDDSTIELVRALGGLSAIAISHPHYYASMVEWSRAFGGVPIYLHEADREWVQHPDPAIVFWSGETRSLNDDLTLIRVGGHFSGFQALHWASGEQGTGALMTGDMPQVCPDRRYVSFMYSYPNLVPVDGATVRHIVATLERYDYSNYTVRGRDSWSQATPSWL